MNCRCRWGGQAPWEAEGRWHGREGPHPGACLPHWPSPHLLPVSPWKVPDEAVRCGMRRGSVLPFGPFLQQAVFCSCRAWLAWGCRTAAGAGPGPLGTAAGLTEAGPHKYELDVQAWENCVCLCWGLVS